MSLSAPRPGCVGPSDFASERADIVGFAEPICVVRSALTEAETRAERTCAHALVKILFSNRYQCFSLIVCTEPVECDQRQQRVKTVVTPLKWDGCITPQSRHRSDTLSDLDVVVCYSKNPCRLVVANPSCRIRFKAFRHPRCCIAAHDIMKLPEAGHEAAEWQAAMEALLLVPEHDGPTMFGGSE